MKPIGKVNCKKQKIHRLLKITHYYAEKGEILYSPKTQPKNSFFKKAFKIKKERKHSIPTRALYK